MYLAEYCNSYDRYMLSPGFEQYLQRNKAAIRYTQTRTSQGLRQYTISNTPAAIKNHGATPPFEITLTAKGRMDVVSVTRHIQYILQSNINTLKTWENSGMRYTDLGNDQTRCTHDFMEIDFVIDNPHALRAQIKDTLDILLSATQDKSEQDEWAEKLEHLAIKLEKIGSDFRDIGNQITSHYTRWNDEFSDCMKKLNAHGYTRHNSITPDGYFSVLTLNHTDPAYREVTLYAIPQGNTTRKTFLIIPYKKMINTLRELITQCDARKNPAPKTTTHALFNSTKPTRVLSFKTPASSIPPAVSQGVNLSHDNILATEQIKGKARRLRLETPDAKTAKMILASMPKMKF